MEKKIARWSYQTSLTENKGWQLVMVGPVHLVEPSHFSECITSQTNGQSGDDSDDFCHSATGEEQVFPWALPREEESLTSILKCISILHECNMPKDMKFSRTRIKASPGNTRERCTILYEQNNAPWEIMDLGVSLDVWTQSTFISIKNIPWNLPFMITSDGVLLMTYAAAG